jgi:hypothetical protein
MKKCTEYTLGKTIISSECDEYPDYSYLGEYTEKIGPGVIIREHDEFYERIPVEMERDYDGRFLGKKEPEYSTYRNGEYSGFKPCNHIPFNPKDWAHVSRKDKSAVIKQYGSLENASYAYAMADYKRMESLNNGHWSYICLTVETTMTTNTGISSVISDSLCGIESDSGDDYFKEIISELKENVKAQLRKMGFSDDEINQSVDNAETKKGEMYL